MRRRSQAIESSEELNIWPAFTDLMSNAFMILSLLLLLALVKSVFLKSVSEATESRSQELEEQIVELEEKLRQRSNIITGLEEEVTGLEGTVASLQNDLGKRTTIITELEGEVERLKSPPVIVIRDSQERKFESGSADLSPGLVSFIKEDLVKQIESEAKNYQGYVVEVIGHTDGQVNQGRSSNLDLILEKVATGSQPVSNLRPGSNADLGLMRALAVVQELQKDERLTKMGLKFRAYSAAQLYLSQNRGYAPSNRNPDQSRRRIEIRFSPAAVER